LPRSPEILADAVRMILTRNAREATGNFYIDDEVLASAGVTDLSRYALKPARRSWLTFSSTSNYSRCTPRSSFDTL
jgi:hypothetical protein